MSTKVDELKKSRMAIVGLLVLVFFLVCLLVYWLVIRDDEGDGGGGGGIPGPPSGSDELALVDLGPGDASCINDILNNIDIDVSRFNALLETDGKLGDYTQDDILLICEENYEGQWFVNNSFAALWNEVTGQQIPVFPSSETLVVAIEQVLDAAAVKSVTTALFNNLPGAGFASVVSIEPEPPVSNFILLPGPQLDERTFPTGITFITFLSIDRFWFVNEIAKESDSVFDTDSTQITQPSRAFIRNSKIDQRVEEICKFLT